MLHPWITVPGVVSEGLLARPNVRATLAVYRAGRSDPTTQLSDSDFWRATLTPAGPATLHVWWRGDCVDAQAWGSGAAWMLDRVERMIGRNDPGFACPSDAHPAVAAAHRNHPGLRVGASSTLYHELLPVVLAQRVTGGEAVAQWRRICLVLGEPAPGPDHGLRLPPAPARLIAHPAWWFHKLGIESKRAEALRTVARYGSRLEEWSLLQPAAVASKLRLLHGIGVWTIGSVTGPALGDADAVAVGDFHIPNMVSWALAREPRGTDERMLNLLQPYSGQRGRVIRLLGLDGHAAPKFGPRQRIQPIQRF